MGLAEKPFRERITIHYRSIADFSLLYYFFIFVFDFLI